MRTKKTSATKRSKVATKVRTPKSKSKCKPTNNDDLFEKVVNKVFDNGPSKTHYQSGEPEIYTENIKARISLAEPKSSSLATSTRISDLGPVVIIKSPRSGGNGLICFHDDLHSITLINLNDGQGFKLSPSAAKELAAHLSSWSDRSSWDKSEFWLAT